MVRPYFSCGPIQEFVAAFRGGEMNRTPTEWVVMMLIDNESFEHRDLNPDHFVRPRTCERSALQTGTMEMCSVSPRAGCNGMSQVFDAFMWSQSHAIDSHVVKGKCGEGAEKECNALSVFVCSSQIMVTVRMRRRGAHRRNASELDRPSTPRRGLVRHLLLYHHTAMIFVGDSEPIFDASKFDRPPNPISTSFVIFCFITTLP